MLFRRSEGRLAEKVPGYRLMMPYVMTSKNSSHIYFSFKVDMERAQAMLESPPAGLGEGRKLTLTHVFLAATVKTLDKFPELNRFISGREIYQRNDIDISFSAKKAFTTKAPIVVIKVRFDPTESLAGLANRVQAKLEEGRSDKESFTDKETNLLLKIPREIRRLLVGLQALLDYFNLLPAEMIEKDIFSASAFIANLGSLGLDAAYHHLYDFGTIPLFATIGKVQPMPVFDEEGNVTMRPMAELKVTMDERITDGFYAARALAYFKELVEDPEQL